MTPPGPPPPLEPGSWVEVAPGVLVHRQDPLQVTSTAILGPLGTVVVDTLADPATARAARADLERLTGVRVVGLVLTHAHYDHTFGAVAFAGLPAWGHPRLAEHLDEHEEPELVQGCAGELELDGDRARWDDVELPRHATAVGAPTTISPGGREIVLEPWPTAHSTSDLVVHVPDAGLWVVGDVVEVGAEPSFEVDSDPAGWATELSTLASLLEPTDLVVPGHGWVVTREIVAAQARTIATIVEVLEENRAHGRSALEAVHSLRAATGWHADTLRRAAHAFDATPR